MLRNVGCFKCGFHSLVGEKTNNDSSMDSIMLQEHLKDDIKRVSKSGDVNLLVLSGKLKEELKTDDAMFCNSLPWQGRKYNISTKNLKHMNETKVTHSKYKLHADR